MTRHGRRLTALASIGALLLVGCRSDDKGSVSGTAAPTTTAVAGDTTAPADTAGETTPDTAADTTVAGDTTPDTAADTTAGTEPAAEAWTVDTGNCSDPAAAEAPIEGELRIGAAQPLSGTPAVAFAPVKEGFELYLKYANDNGLVPGITLVPDIRDDQYDPTQTPGVVESLIDENINIFSGIIGSPNNLAVRDLLNEECIPQLNALTGSPAWGEVAEYPWTTGALVPYTVEAKIYAKSMHEQLGDGATVGVFTVNNDFGKIYLEAFKQAAADEGLEIVEEQTIEPTETTPPTNQVNAIAAKAPGAVMAVPLGAQCPTFTKEIVNAKAVNADWKPLVFQTNTCASRLFVSLLAAGSGDGVFTSSNLLDPTDPKNDANANLKVYEDAYAAAGLAGDPATTATGWQVGEITVNIIKAAQDSGTLSRKSIIEAARNLTFTPSLVREGVQYKMNGEADGYAFQSLQILQWNEASGTFTEIGDLNTGYED
jgi:branched-chain amino acid transport system substrate-binding protein